MKKFLVLLVVSVSSTLLFAQSEKYAGAMKQNLSMMDSAFMKNNFAELANNFERIGDAEKSQWLPYYYAAYCTAMSALTEKDKSKVDGIADKADQQIKKAEAIAGKENSETCVIKSMIASSHMMVDPQNRWQQYGPDASTNIEKAKKLDPSNPRPVYLEGQGKFYTPESFGGGKAAAKEYFLTAIKMFDTFKAESELHPTWGKQATAYFLEQVK
ncbi:MAG TPA: hypothetical protein VEZ17_06505 [Chitinophagaceae bacterium]|nr:hypothetical protein [Chitinophagaceae bacterium]